MNFLQRWINDVTKAVKSFPLIFYIHGLMVAFALPNLSFYFEPLVSNMKVPILYWITCGYFFVFVIAYIKATRRKGFYLTAVLLGFYILYLMMKSDVEFVPGTVVKLNFWPIAVFYMGFIAWPVLGLPFYVFSLGLSWKQVLLLYSVVFVPIIIYKNMDTIKYAINEVLTSVKRILGKK